MGHRGTSRPLREIDRGRAEQIYPEGGSGGRGMRSGAISENAGSQPTPCGTAASEASTGTARARRADARDGRDARAPLAEVIRGPAPSSLPVERLQSAMPYEAWTRSWVPGADGDAAIVAIEVTMRPGRDPRRAGAGPALRSPADVAAKQLGLCVRKINSYSYYPGVTVLTLPSEGALHDNAQAQRHQYRLEPRTLWERGRAAGAGAGPAHREGHQADHRCRRGGCPKGSSRRSPTWRRCSARTRSCSRNSWRSIPGRRPSRIAQRLGNDALARRMINERHQDLVRRRLRRPGARGGEQSCADHGDRRRHGHADRGAGRGRSGASPPSAPSCSPAREVASTRAPRQSRRAAQPRDAAART